MTSSSINGAGSPTLSTAFDIGNVHSDCIIYTPLPSIGPFLSPNESASTSKIVFDANIPISPLDQSLVPSIHFKPIESVTDTLPYPHAPDTRISISNSFYYDLFDDACKEINKNWISEIKMSCSSDASTAPSCRNVLSRAGQHQRYTTSSLPVISFCPATYPITDGFGGAGFLKLGADLIRAAAITS